MSEENLRVYNAVKAVPPTAQKEIKGGRMSGKTDINPMWRIKALTEQFGICGVGWRYEIAEKRLERGAQDEIAAFVDINLYIKVDDKWSEAIPGTGGNSFVTKESRGLYTSDECFKMALTDAISVACKALGFGADVYWDKDKTKYTSKSEPEPKKDSPDVAEKAIMLQRCIDAGRVLDDEKKKELFADNFPGKQVDKLSHDELVKLHSLIKEAVLNAS